MSFSSSLDLSLPSTSPQFPIPSSSSWSSIFSVEGPSSLDFLYCHHPFSSWSRLRILVSYPPGEPLLLELLLLLPPPAPATFASLTARCHLNCPVFMLPPQHAILILKIKEIDIFWGERNLLVVLRTQQQGQYEKSASQMT